MAEVLIPVAKGILHGLISLATDQITSQVNQAWGFKQNLKKLRQRLKIILALLQDAENRRITSDTMMVWLKKIKAAACDAENVLDELNYEDLRRKIEVQNRMRNKVRDLSTLSDPLLFHFKMANKVHKVNKLLDRICNAAKDIGLEPAKQLVGPINEPMEVRKSGFAVGDSEVVGRDGDVNVLVDMLIGSDIEFDLPVIAMVGMGGLGKTTVAQIVYHHVMVMDYFNERIWICVSDDLPIDKLLNEMVESLTENRCNMKNRKGVERKLKEKLMGKKYLLVLDNVFNMDSRLWVDLRNILLGMGGSNKSKILVTTRSKEVVSAMQSTPSCTHELAQLSEDDCWTILWKKALAHREPSEARTLEGVGRRMVEKSKGLPLAISTLGGLLHSKKDVQEWESIEKSEVWSSSESKDGILPILRLSFDHLPSASLKQSFAYCSIFQKGQVIIKDELIQLWMGLGFLQSSSRSKMEMEEVGNEYFNILLLNSLFQEVHCDLYNNITACTMHDYVHDLALYVSQGNCYTSEVSEVKINSSVQHISYHREGTQLDIPKENVGKLRTLVLSNPLPKNSKYFKHIRALSIVGYVEKLPSSICKSIHLRFLDLYGTGITEVPESITKLYNLETLKLPYSCRKLPEGFHNLVKLRHFHLPEYGEVILPMKIGQLTSLRTLPYFAVGENSGHKIEELGSLSKLRGRFIVKYLQHVKDKEEAEKAKLLEKSNIQELQLCWDKDFAKSENNHEDVLEGLKPHQKVMGLILENFGGRGFPSWMSRKAHSLQNLVKIELNDCWFCEEVPALGHLPHLAIVRMHSLNSLKRIGLELYGLDEGIINNSSSSGAVVVKVFPALRELYIYNMSQLEEWSPAIAICTVKAFAHLESLVIWNCPKLITIPAFNGVTSFQKLKIGCCPEFTYIPEELLQPTLVILRLFDCPKLKTPYPDALRSLTSLRKLELVKCPKWGSYWEEGLFCITSLESLEIGCFGDEFRYFPWPSTSAASQPHCHFLSLESLIFWGWREVKSLPDELDQLENLTELNYMAIEDFEGLESLPQWLCKLSSLGSLEIRSCPLLKDMCNRENEEWLKIAHIPRITIEDWQNTILQVLRFLDKAAVMTNTEGANTNNRWRLRTVTQVEELKSFIRVLPIWATTIALPLSFGHLQTFFVSQAAIMDRKMGPNCVIPAGTVPIFGAVKAVLLVPLYEKLFVPALRRYTGHQRSITSLQWMGVGLFISIFAMISATLTTKRRKDDANPSAMSVFWLFPQFFLLGSAEVFTYVGQLEFFYDQASDGTRSLSNAGFQLG